jgi:hypothetical protein
MLSTSNRPGTLPGQSLLLAIAQMNSTHTAGQGATIFSSGRQFLNRRSASIPPPMSLTLKDRFSPNTGSFPFHISAKRARCTRNPSTVADISSSARISISKSPQRQYTPGYVLDFKGPILAESRQVCVYISEKEVKSTPAQNAKPNPEICR